MATRPRARAIKHSVSCYNYYMQAQARGRLNPTLTHSLTCPKTKPSLKKMMTENIERQHGMVTPKIILSFLSVALQRGRWEF